MTAQQLGGTVGSSMHQDLEVVTQDSTIIDSAVRMRERSEDLAFGEKTPV